MDKRHLDSIVNIVGEGNVLTDEVMSKHITFRVGGKASCFVEITEETQLVELVKYLKKEKLNYYVIGNGSNLIVRDEGYAGVIIKIGEKYGNVFIDGDKIKVQAGAMLVRVARQAWEASLRGMECLSGIPGTIGGAITMNAGAYGTEIKDIIIEARVFDIDSDKIITLNRDELDLGYRHSIVMDKNYVVLAAIFQLQKGDKEEAKALMDSCTAKRKEKQPLEYPSAGSTFKRPEGYFAGKLIEDAGLSGYEKGGAAVSTKHCGFVINRKNATASDVLDVIKHVQQEVAAKFGVELETEVRVL